MGEELINGLFSGIAITLRTEIIAWTKSHNAVTIFLALLLNHKRLEVENRQSAFSTYQTCYPIGTFIGAFNVFLRWPVELKSYFSAPLQFQMIFSLCQCLRNCEGLIQLEFLLVGHRPYSSQKASGSYTKILPWLVSVQAAQDLLRSQRHPSCNMYVLYQYPPTGGFWKLLNTPKLPETTCWGVQVFIILQSKNINSDRMRNSLVHFHGRFRCFPLPFSLFIKRNWRFRH